MFNIVENLYRPGARIGNGSTAAAIRYELATGNKVEGKYHVRKGLEQMNALKQWIDSNPGRSINAIKIMGVATVPIALSRGCREVYE